MYLCRLMLCSSVCSVAYWHWKRGLQWHGFPFIIQSSLNSKLICIFFCFLSEIRQNSMRSSQLYVRQEVFFTSQCVFFVICDFFNWGWLFTSKKRKRRRTHYLTWKRHFVANSEQSRIVLSGGTCLFSGAILSVSINCSYFVKMRSQCKWIQKESWLLFHGQEHKNLSIILWIPYNSSLPSLLKTVLGYSVNYCDIHFNSIESLSAFSLCYH